MPVRSPVRRARVSSVAVTEEGIEARSRREVVLDVAFDGRRIYSFWLRRDGVRQPTGGWLVPWPPALHKFLKGSTRLTLTVHETGQVVHDAEVTLGNRPGRIEVVNKDGQSLSLDKS